MTNMFSQPGVINSNIPNQGVITAGLDYDKIYEEMEKRMPTPQQARRTSLHIRTKYELKCLDHYESYAVMSVQQWKDSHNKDAENLGHRQVVLLGYPRRMPPPTGYDPMVMVQSNAPTALCFFYTWDAGEKALDALMDKTNGVVDLRELLVEGAPEVDDEIGKEARPIDLGGPAVNEPNTSSESPLDMQRELERILREQENHPRPHPMLPYPGDYGGPMYRAVMATDRPNRNGDVIRMSGIEMRPNENGEIRIEGESVTLLRRGPHGDLEIVGQQSRPPHGSDAVAQQGQGQAHPFAAAMQRAAEEGPSRDLRP